MGVIEQASGGSRGVVLAAVAHRVLPARGETRSGDGVCVRREGEIALIAVIDALGHGQKAAEVCDRALAHLARVSFVGAEVSSLVVGLGEALRGTRGAAALVCLWDGQTLFGCGVGNVELRAVGGRVSAQLTPGVLGAPLKRLHSFSARIETATTIFMHSDGISSRIPFGALAAATSDPLALCDAALAAGRREHDDATVLVARFQEPSP